MYRLLLAALLSIALLFPSITPSTRAEPDHDQWPLEEPVWANPGPYRSPEHTDFNLESFGADQRVVGTYFFYWFMADAYRQRVRERGFDPYPYHPTDLETVSFLDPAWYEKQFTDMQAAG